AAPTQAKIGLVWATHKKESFDVERRRAMHSYEDQWRGLRIARRVGDRILLSPLGGEDRAGQAERQKAEWRVCPDPICFSRRPGRDADQLLPATAGLQRAAHRPAHL